MKLINDIRRILKIKKAIKEAKQIAKDNQQLTIDLEKALLNIKAGFEILAGLLPSLKSVASDIKALIDA